MEMIPSRPKPNIAPKNGWLEDESFLLGRHIFRGYVAFLEGKDIYKMTSVLPISFRQARGHHFESIYQSGYDIVSNI